MDSKKATVANGTPGDLLRLIRSGQATTRAQLAVTTGLARSTIAQRIESLAASGLIRVNGEAPSTGGRPATVLGFNPDAGAVLVADLGATHSRVALANLGGEILAETTADIEIAAGPKHVLDWVDERFEQLLVEASMPRQDIVGIGIGLPGPVEFAEGRPVSPPIMPGWDGYDVRGHFVGRFHVPVLVDNDVNIMALGESWMMEPTLADFLFVKVGTGIGSGLILGGDIHRGAQGAAGDIGHIPVAQFDTVCRCGNIGCVESVASGSAIARQLAAMGKGTTNSRDVMELVSRGDADAGQAVREAGRLLGRVLAAAVNLLNPAMIMIGGDLSEAGDQLLAGVREVVYQRSTALATNGLVIASSNMGDRAGVVGAAAMVIEHVLDPASIDATLIAEGVAS
ncbi:MAG: ROK family protein [Acidimicrobiales bacterium]